MIIRDKQDLRKCIKQCVRRAEMIDSGVDLSVLQGEYGIAAYLSQYTPVGDSLQEAFDSACNGSPFAERPSTLLAALNALSLPAHNLDKAEAIIMGFGHQAYLSAVLNSLHARQILVRIPIEMAEAVAFEDERFAPLLVVDEAMFAPGRYGVDYGQAAHRIAAALQSCGARDITCAAFDAASLAYCLIPVCEDTQSVLHIHVSTSEQLSALAPLCAAHPLIRVLISAEGALEADLIHQMAHMEHILLELSDPANISLALRKLGTRFIPYASHAASPEGMLGGWIRAKEALWQILYEAYLPLARTGFELTREQIEADVEMLLCGSFSKLYSF